MAKATTQMSFLAKLELTQLKAKPQGVSNVSPTAARRAKLIAKIQEQIKLAEAQLAGDKYVVTKQVTKKDADGNKTKSEKEVRLSAWWWGTPGKDMQLVCRYGVKILPLNNRGLKAISVPNLKAVPGILATLIQAVENGELDDVLAHAAIRESKAK